MQLIIPMSGVGARFLKSGYKIPKPLITVENQSIISHIVDLFPDISSITFICNKDHLNNPHLKMRELLLRIRPNAKIIPINPHKKGPIYAVLKSMNNIEFESPVIVNYCDFNFIWDYEAFKKHIKTTNCDGCVVTYKGFHPHMLRNTNYAYVKLKDTQIKDIQEKKPFTKFPMNELASAGTYYFKSVEIMKKYFERTIKEDLSINNEFYVSLSFKPMIKDNLILNNFDINYFMQWGTPEDLNEFNWYSNLFKNKIKRSLKNTKKIEGTLIMPCAGLGKRFSNKGYPLPKPLIEVSNQPMFLQAIRDLDIMKKKKLIIRENMIKKDLFISTVKNTLPEADIKIIKHQTRGQAETCLLGIDNQEMELPILISACDNGILFDEEKLKNLMSDQTIDIIVFGFRGFPGGLHSPEMYGWIEEQENIIKKIHVKRSYKDPSKDPIVVGTFFFKKAEIYKKIAEQSIKNNQKINNEFYVDSCINLAISQGYKVVLFEPTSFLCWGTPNDLDSYKYWQKCFDKWPKHIYRTNKDEDFLKL